MSLDSESLSLAVFERIAAIRCASGPFPNFQVMRLARRRLSVFNHIIVDTRPPAMSHVSSHAPLVRLAEEIVQGIRSHDSESQPWRYVPCSC